MSTQQVFGIMSGVFMAISLVWNVTQIIRGKVQPALASWIIWASLDVILAVSMFYSNLLNPQMAVAAVGASAVMVLAIPYGKSGWSRIDLICLGGGLAAIVMWFLTRDPMAAMWISLSAILLGCLPTYESMREAPEREDRVFWTLAITSSTFAVIGTEEMSVNALAQPVGFVMAQAYAVWLLFKPCSVKNA